MPPWYLFEAESDPNNAWAIWKQIFEYVGDMYSHAPLKRMEVCWSFPSLIFKQGAKVDPNDYRPISVLPVVSKLG